MKTFTADAGSEVEAAGVCFLVAGWTPEALREVDSGYPEEPERKRFICFECALDAELWDSFE